MSAGRSPQAGRATHEPSRVAPSRPTVSVPNADSRIARLIEMQEGKRKRPFSCRCGFHRFYRVRWLLTTGNAVCDKCGACLALSLFGEFDYTMRESANFLREHREKLEGVA